jgi:hypothetical protein
MSSDSNQNVPTNPPNTVQSTDGLDALPNAPAPATVDPQHGLTIPNDAVPNLLTRRPDDPPIHTHRRPPPGKKILPVKSNTKSKDKSEHEPSPSPPPKSPTPEAAHQLPATSSNNQNKPPTPKAKPVKKDNPAAPKKPVVTKPSPIKVRLTISKPKPTSTREQNGPRVPVRGEHFPDTGFVPTGRKLKTGQRKGHLSNEDCSSSLPNGCSLKEWKNKFRSVESTLLRQLNKDKDRLDDMRDAGWVSDRTLHMLAKDKKREAAKATKKAREERWQARLAGEKNEAMEAVEEQDEEMKDVEEQDEEMKDVEEEGDIEETKEEEEEENQVYVPPQIEENMDDIYDA